MPHPSTDRSHRAGRHALRPPPRAPLTARLTVAGMVAVPLALLALACGEGSSAPMLVGRVIVSTPVDTAGVGDTLRVTVTVLDPSGNVVPASEVHFSVSDTAVASVDGAGLVRARRAGRVTITAVAADRTGQTQLTVIPVIRTLSLGGRETIAVGDTVHALPLDANGAPLPPRTFVWRSSDTTVARVDTVGVVRGVAAGTATVSAERDGRRAEATVRVM